MFSKSLKNLYHFKVSLAFYYVYAQKKVIFCTLVDDPMHLYRIVVFSSLALLLLFIPCRSRAQVKVLHGLIRDQHSNEPVPFASVQWKKAGTGKLADSAGAFVIHIPIDSTDTLEVTSVGYQDFALAAGTLKGTGDTIHLQVNMVPGKYTAEFVVRTKVNRGLLMWRRIVAHKPDNDRYRFRNFSYELYNKLELDIKNLNKEKLSQVKMLRPFNFILNNMDTSEGVPYLPAYLTESISHYYYQESPLKRREV